MKQERRIKKELIRFDEYLRSEEKSPATRQKYLQTVRGFLSYTGCKLSKDNIISYKEALIAEGRASTGINATLSGIRSYLRSKGMREVKVRNLRVQRSVYAREDSTLSKKEYEKLLSVCKSKPDKTSKRDMLIVETICATGIRVSELRYFTVESIRGKEIRIRLKGKERTILMPGKLRKRLLSYAKESGIGEGTVFLNGKGKPLHRSYIWHIMKSLARKAGVPESKVYPHNLRRLFARCFYEARKDIARLADVLGHSSIDTTRIYIAMPAKEHTSLVEKLKLAM